MDAYVAECEADSGVEDTVTQLRQPFEEPHTTGAVDAA